jgi:ATP-dependent exoDNAse (exonuclease V) alpha subunit
VIDEAGLLSAKDAHGLLSLAVQQQARVILVGDTRQLSAVEAGNPFKSLQAGGIQTAFLDESRRQKTAALKQAVNLLATDQVESAFQTLVGAGAIQTIQSSPARLQQVATDYLAMGEEERDQTLLLAGTNQERLALTALIRAGLQAQGQLSTDGFTLASLRRKDMTQAQAGYAAHYASGDIVTLSQQYKRQGLVKQQPYQVIQVDGRRNRLTLANAAGQMLEIDPMACPNKTVYTRQAIPVAVGDRLRWTRNDRSQNIRNGQAFTHSGPINIRNAKFAEDQGPIDERCTCPVCATWTRAYVHHLIRSGEILGAMLMTQHNLHYYQMLMADMRAAIAEDRFAAFAADFRRDYLKQ